MSDLSWLPLKQIRVLAKRSNVELVKGKKDQILSSLKGGRAYSIALNVN